MNMKVYIRILRDEDLADRPPIDPLSLDKSRNWQRNTASCTALPLSTLVSTRSFAVMYVLITPGTGRITGQIFSAYYQKNGEVT